MEKERGAFLTVWLVLMLIANAWTAINYFVIEPMISSQSFEEFRFLEIQVGKPEWATFTLGILSIFNVLLTVFLFMWKKWAFFAFCGVAAVALGINLFLGYGLFSLVGLAGPVILYLAMRGKWNQFE